MASRKKKTSSSNNIGCLVLLLGGIVLAVVFAIKFPDIRQTLEKTRFFDLILQKVTTTKAVTPPTTIPSAPPTTRTVPPVPGTTRQISLFFVSISEVGAISSREVKRTLAADDLPLTDAIKALIAGPSEAEIRSGLVSLVPGGTKLLGIMVKGSTAVIDLGEAFMYNRYGREGFSAQLRQIVFTATSFPSVQDVQILVEGKARDYLGGEGVYIGKPLSRNSF